MNDDFLEQEIETDIDLTPLIDVIFMLLLFFILASTFSLPALRVALPTAATAAPVENGERLIFTIDADGRLAFGPDPLAPENLPPILAAHPDRSIELRVDRAAPFASFIAVLDRLRGAGRNDVLITAHSEPPAR